MAGAGDAWTGCSAKRGSRRGGSGRPRRAPRPDAGGGASPVSLGGGEGAAQDPVEDGHLDPQLLLRRADLRGARPGPRGDRHLLRGTASPHRRHRLRGDRRGRPGAASRGLPGRRADAGVPARPRPGALPEGGRGPRLGAAGRRGAAAGGEGRNGDATAYGGVPGRRTAAAGPAGPARPAGACGRARRCRSRRSSRRRRSARRFVSSAMSLGALSPEAHATLSIAMNRMGARSNSGEGGEDPHNYHGFANGDRADNRIKQVASRPLRRHHRVPDPGRGAGDQDRAGRQARRRRPAAGPQGDRPDRPAAARGARHSADLAATAPRHLLDRGPGAADPRPQDGEPARPGRA